MQAAPVRERAGGAAQAAKTPELQEATPASAPQPKRTAIGNLDLRPGQAGGAAGQAQGAARGAAGQARLAQFCLSLQCQHAAREWGRGHWQVRRARLETCLPVAAACELRSRVVLPCMLSGVLGVSLTAVEPRGGWPGWASGHEVQRMCARSHVMHTPHMCIPDLCSAWYPC